MEEARSARNEQLRRPPNRPLVHIFKSKTLKEINFFLTETCVFLVHLVQCFFMAKFNNKVFKNQKKLQNYKKKKKCFIFLVSEKFVKCMHHPRSAQKLFYYNFLVNFSGSTVCKSLLFICASACYDTAVVGWWMLGHYQ